MNPKAKATTTARTGNNSKSGSTMSNEGTQNECEKQVFLCVSAKICHLTHFTRLAKTDTNELIVSDFLGWYADQMFGRSSATTFFITSNMSHAIEPSWQSVFLKALEVVHKAVAEKKEIMINDMQ
jgi:hypothetical protein